MDLSLHDIHADSIDLALDKARQYRSLLEPEIAESICLDVLNIDPANQAALVLYILALTDQISISGSQSPFQAIETAISQLQSDYKQLYYTGIFHERRARFMLIFAAVNGLGRRLGWSRRMLGCGGMCKQYAMFIVKMCATCTD